MLLSQRLKNEAFGIEIDFQIGNFGIEEVDATLFTKGEDKDGKFWVIETENGLKKTLRNDVETFMI
tara:strand:+ start:700 stop:897 length:198 start_codon:yes stop_codon:yes gene_type:complete